MKTQGIENTPIQLMFWKDEILQVLYWMDGEGIGSKVTLMQMLPFLNTSEENLRYHLDKLVIEGLLQSDQHDTRVQYCLSNIGKQEGGKHFAEAFHGMQKAGHGECGPDCEFCYGTDGVKLDNCVHNCASQ
ncbi:hypothetical protein ACFO5O_11805 [Geojedonia litorea]|uniref:Transcriptional regulator n=1 Tax=Geojedonia litorea TaxID=1268269 RepID=A0ABV9N6A0_9FLAO